MYYADANYMYNLVQLYLNSTVTYDNQCFISDWGLCVQVLGFHDGPIAQGFALHFRVIPFESSQM